MLRSPKLPCLALAASTVLALSAGAQQAPPAIDPAAVLATLKDLRSKQTVFVNKEKVNVLAQINAAMADPAKAYDQAISAVEFSTGSGSDGTKLIEWRKKQGELLRNRDFLNGLRLQLMYLGLTWQHQMGTRTADLIAPLIDYTGQASGAIETIWMFDIFKKSIGDSAFAAYFQVGSFMKGMKDWEDHPFNIDDIFLKTILPEMRTEKDPHLMSYWENHIKAESAKADATQNALIIGKFKNIKLPGMQWDRAEDEVLLGRQNQGILDMLAIIRAHPDHPDFKEWAARVEELVTPASSAPITPGGPASGAAAAPVAAPAPPAATPVPVITPAP